MTLTLPEAADLLKISADALLRKARAGTVPGARIGRRWVFIRDDLLALIREQHKARVCRSIEIHRAAIGTSDSRSAASRSAAHPARLTASPLKNLRRDFATISGGKSDSATSLATHGPKLSIVGTPRRITEGDSETGNA